MIKNYFSKFGEKERTPKYYFNDNGLLNLFFTKEETGTAIQVAYSTTNISDDREIKSLVETAKKLKEAKKFVIITYVHYYCTSSGFYFRNPNFNYLFSFFI